MLGDKTKIHGDLYILFKILKELFIYIILLIPYFLLFIVYFFINAEKRATYFNKLFLEPFKVLKEFNEWFFEAKITANLILFLFFMYLIQIFILIDFGSAFATSPNDLFSFEIYTLLTSIFLHGSITHLLSNSLVLLIFGRIVERALGNQVLLIFLLGGLVANIISHIISIYLEANFTSWGASGAISALVMLGIFLEPLAISFFFIPAFVIGWFFILSDLNGLFIEDNINQFAHIGGYIGVLLLVYFLERKHQLQVKKGFLINLLLISISYTIILNQEVLLGFIL